jgi:parallel beta-helix repeat protein
VKKSTLLLVLLLILGSATFPVLKIGMAQAEAMIYIRADGSVEGTDKIQRTGNIYSFTDNIEGIIVFERDNIVLDGAGYTLNGVYTGITLEGRTNVTIKNLNVINGLPSIYLNNSSNNQIINNTLTSTVKFAPIRVLWLENSSNHNKISGNIILLEQEEEQFVPESVVNIRKSLYNEIVGNNITTNMPCIGLDSLARIGISDYSTHSNHTIISGNTINFTGGFWGFYTGFNTTFTNNVLVGCSLFICRSSQNTIADNLVDGKPIIYLEGVTDQVLEGGEAGQILLENCQNITVKNYDFSNVVKGGVQLLHTNSSKISNYTGSIYLERSFYNSITGSDCVEIELYKSSNNTIAGNTVTNTEGVDYSNGITLYSSNYNNIIENNITQNHYSGIKLETSRYNLIAYNNLTYNAQGMSLQEYSSNNTIYGNNVAHNHNSAMYVQDASYNLLFGNNFFANNHQIGGWDSGNIWDNGTIGNYWSDYDGTDENMDGIGDSPYSFIIDIRWPPTADPITNYDNFPLMELVDIKAIVPEFPSWIILPLFLVATLLSVIVRKKIRVL